MPAPAESLSGKPSRGYVDSARGRLSGQDGADVWTLYYEHTRKGAESTFVDISAADHHHEQSSRGLNEVPTSLHLST